MPDGSCVMFAEKMSFFWIGSLANLPPPPYSRPLSFWPLSSDRLWHSAHPDKRTRYFPRSARLADGCDGCGVVIGLGAVLMMSSSGPGRLRFGTSCFTAGSVRM